ncbi:MAG: F0F1 ATP synthase subunit gamma [Marinilabiliales bacterium]|nr:F0F1 ATP synthase subunit gamma [Marinilabiliales bacterium]
MPPAAEADRSSTDYIYEPDQVTIVGELIPKTLRIKLYKALLDSFAAEHGARMTAMHQATDNATDLIRDLTSAVQQGPPGLHHQPAA